MLRLSSSHSMSRPVDDTSHGDDGDVDDVGDGDDGDVDYDDEDLMRR